MSKLEILSGGQAQAAQRHAQAQRPPARGRGAPPAHGGAAPPAVSPAVVAASQAAHTAAHAARVAARTAARQARTAGQRGDRAGAHRFALQARAAARTARRHANIAKSGARSVRAAPRRGVHGDADLSAVVVNRAGQGYVPIDPSWVKPITDATAQRDYGNYYDDPNKPDHFTFSNQLMVAQLAANSDDTATDAEAAAADADSAAGTDTSSPSDTAASDSSASDSGSSDDSSSSDDGSGDDSA